MKVTLPDGTALELPDGATGADAAAAIGPGLARAALAVKQNGEVRDLARPLHAGEPLEIITDRSGQDALDLIRHDAAHVLAAAVLELYPGVKISIGPPIEHGFYYDFDFPDGRHALRRRLRAHRGADARARQGRRAVRARGRARRARRSSASAAEGQDYKVELIEDLVARPGRRDRQPLHERPVHRPLPRPARAEHRSASARSSCSRSPAPTGAATRAARCSRASTAPRSSRRRSSTSTSSGSSRRAPATTASSARELGLFTFCELSPGSPFWQPNGMAIWNELTDAVARARTRERGYREVKTPILYDVELWKQSGHWARLPRQHVLHRRRGPRRWASSR